MPSPLPGRPRRRLLLPLLLALLSPLAVPATLPARAAWTPEGVDLTRPRLLSRPGDLAALRARLDAAPEAEPWRTLFADMQARAASADALALEDHAIASERIKSRAAKTRAFLYALERHQVGAAVVPFADPTEREALAVQVQDWLVHMYTRSRLAVPEPLGGWDRDISTSEELLQYATAYDTLKGAGWDFGDDEAVIVENLAALAGELYHNYIAPETASDNALFHQNNHRSKTGAALAATGVAIAEYTPAPGSDPDGVREPTQWIEYGIEQIDLVMRWSLQPGDGAYAEGPHYFRFAAQNLLPFLRAWDRLVGGAAWPVGELSIPSLWRHPTFLRGARWMLDVTLSDGSLAPLDDSNVGRSFYYAAAPRSDADAAGFAWRFAHQTRPYDSDGNVEMAPEQILWHDPDVVPAPPPGSPTAFYLDGGQAIFRSRWDEEGVVAIVSGEYDTASEFGRDRDGLAVTPQSHEHEEPAAFLLHAYGERLLLDPGMIHPSESSIMRRTRHHSGVLVDGAGAGDYGFASIIWSNDREGRPRANGHTRLSHAWDTDFADAVRATTRYGSPEARIERRFLFPDHRYLVVADDVGEAGGPGRDFTWLLQGNGGGGEPGDGDYALLPAGARWSRSAARVDAGFAFAGHTASVETRLQPHEEPPQKQERQHAAWRGTVRDDRVRAVGLAYPTRSGVDPPELADPGLPGIAGLRLTDAADDRRLLAVHRPTGAAEALPGAATGLGLDVASDARLVLVDTTLAGALRLAWSEGGRYLELGGRRWLETVTSGVLALRPDESGLDLVVGGVDPVLELHGLAAAPGAVDGACGYSFVDGVLRLSLGRERRLRVRDEAGNSRPAADPGAERRVEVGVPLALDGRASCDADGHALEPQWTLVSAPPGSDWLLSGEDGWTPTLTPDRPGPYRVELSVVDELGLASAPRRVLVVAGAPCADGFDGDLDGEIDGDDADCDVPLPNEPPLARAAAFATPRATPLRVGAGAGVLADDEDPDGDAVVAVLAEPPLEGDLWLRADGSFEYVPDPDYEGPDAFSYRARDATGRESAPVEVAIAVPAPRAGAGAALLALGLLARRARSLRPARQADRPPAWRRASRRCPRTASSQAGWFSSCGLWAASEITHRRAPGMASAIRREGSTKGASCSPTSTVVGHASPPRRSSTGAWPASSTASWCMASGSMASSLIRMRSQ